VLEISPRGMRLKFIVRKVGKAYIWVFTNLEEVVFCTTLTRGGVPAMTSQRPG